MFNNCAKVKKKKKKYNKHSVRLIMKRTIVENLSRRII